MTLNIESASVSYGAVAAVRAASLDVGDGEAVALIGSNGAGKSTLLKAISGLITPSEGEITYNTKSLVGVPPHKIAKAGVSHVPEGRRLFPRMSVRENLLLGAFGRRDGQVTQDLNEQLDRFPRLRERLEQDAGTLSGGEQQMVAIARALMSRPSLLLLDEPSLGLSPIMASTVFEAIDGIHKAGTALLLVEQNAAKALTVTSRCYVMAAGEVVREGSSAELHDDPEVQEIYLGTRVDPKP